MLSSSPIGGSLLLEGPHQTEVINQGMDPPWNLLINRPSVARAVLETALLLSWSLSHPFLKISSKHLHSQTINQGLSKHQEVRSTPVTKVKKMIAVFWDLLGAIKR